MVRLTDRPAMTIAVDLGRKAAKQTNKTTPFGVVLRSKMVILPPLYFQLIKETKSATINIFRKKIFSS